MNRRGSVFSRSVSSKRDLTNVLTLTEGYRNGFRQIKKKHAKIMDYSPQEPNYCHIRFETWWW